MQGQDWVNLFVSLESQSDGYQPSNVTPHMHILVQHVPDFISKHRNLQLFSCQGTYFACSYEMILYFMYTICLLGVEKLNDDAKKIFFRSSNKWDPAKEMLSNDYKLEKLQNYRRKKCTYK